MNIFQGDYFSRVNIFHGQLVFKEEYFSSVIFLRDEHFSDILYSVSHNLLGLVVHGCSNEQASHLSAPEDFLFRICQENVR